MDDKDCRSKSIFAKYKELERITLAEAQKRREKIEREKKRLRRKLALLNELHTPRSLDNWELVPRKRKLLRTLITCLILMGAALLLSVFFYDAPPWSLMEGTLSKPAPFNEKEACRQLQSNRPDLPYLYAHEPTLQQRAREDTEEGDNATRRSVVSGDVIHTIKTGRKMHLTRMRAVLDTWYPLVARDAFVLTDNLDRFLLDATGGRAIGTRCGTDHTRADLCCKLQLEYDLYRCHTSPGKRWWCHWDDDMYVNVPALHKLLGRYDPSFPWYIGRASFASYTYHLGLGRTVRGRFAHGGCGFCLSDALVRLIGPHAGNDGIVRLGRAMNEYDDSTLGYVVTVLAGVNLTESSLLNSHLHRSSLLAIAPHRLASQVSISYSTSRRLHIPIRPPLPSFPIETDPSRFYSYHCMLFPETRFCAALYPRDEEVEEEDEDQ